MDRMNPSLLSSSILVEWLLGFLIVILITPWIRGWSIRMNFFDRATQFHSDQPRLVPRFGGLALFIAFTVVYWIPTWGGNNLRISPQTDWIFGTCLAMFALGFWDDLQAIDARIKLLIQILIASCAYAGGLQIGHLENPFTHQLFSLGRFDAPLTVFWMIAVTNLINLVDGIDGLAAGLLLVLMILLAIVSRAAGNEVACLFTLGMCGALSGFLFFNFPPARIFMGDGGAYFLGLLVAEVSLLNSNKGTVAAALAIPFFALGLPIIDTSFTIIRRLLVGLPLFRADRRHIHHRLVGMGFSQRRVVLLLYACCAFFALLGLAVFIQKGRLLPILFGVFMFVTLMSARMFGFIQGWYKLGRLLTQSILRRKETRYALLLGKLLEEEAERCESLHALWTHFGSILVRLKMDGVEWRRGAEVWRQGGGEGDPERICVHVIRGREGGTLTFYASPGCDMETFRLLSELATESWGRAVGKSIAIHGGTV